ncbi:hypothetical protein AC244_16180 [Ensifer adhaerens]|uniref:Uncharacterized protein n=1 Tax=Ensifer adhaerens TaxID=106592 RepID=A0A0L8BT39_ENSAD|nr:hypothetical protein AC244_16180 [Ensifer adhaerens]
MHQRSALLLPDLDCVSSGVLTALAPHLRCECEYGLILAEATLQVTAIEMHFTATVLAPAKEFVPFRQIGERDLLRSAGWCRVASRFDREGNRSSADLL